MTEHDGFGTMLAGSLNHRKLGAQELADHAGLTSDEVRAVLTGEPPSESFLRALAPDGHLAELGLINPARFRSALRSAAAGLPIPLATIEQALATEAWLVAHHREPNQAWTSEPMRTAHG